MLKWRRFWRPRLVWKFLGKVAIVKGYWTTLGLRATEEPPHAFKKLICNTLFTKKKKIKRGKIQEPHGITDSAKWRQQEGDPDRPSSPFTALSRV